MAAKRDSRRTGQNRLDREQILDTSMRIVDKGGLNALSMRRLGSELGVDPMAIYYHLPNKAAIISGLVQRVFDEIARSARLEDGAPWQERVRHWALTYHRAARAHSNLIVYLVGNADAATESVMRANEALYAALSASGLPSRDVLRAADMIVDYIHGVILGEAAPEAVEGGWRGTVAEHIESGPRDGYPAIQRVFQHLEPAELALDVGFAIDVMIAGLERRLAG